MKLKFKIHPLFFVFLFILIYQGLFEILLVYVLTIFLHELAHFFVAKKRGYHLNKFTLMPHGISLSGENELFFYVDEIVIALAGPLCNLFLALFCVALWWVFPTSYVYTKLFVDANILTALLNFLPIFPFDGGRIYLALMSKKITRQKALKILKICGIVISICFVFCFVLTTFFKPNFSVLVFGLFCFVTVLLDDKTSVYEKSSVFSNKKQALKRGVVVREIAVIEDVKLYKLLSQLKPDSFTNFRVFKSDLSFLGYIKETELENLIKRYSATTTLKTILN